MKSFKASMVVLCASVLRTHLNLNRSELILTLQELASVGSQTDDDSAVFEDFMPMALEQNRDKNHLQLPTFDAALDKYFSRVMIKSSKSILNPGRPAG